MMLVGVVSMETTEGTVWFIFITIIHLRCEFHRCSFKPGLTHGLLLNFKCQTLKLFYNRLVVQ